MFREAAAAVAIAMGGAGQAQADPVGEVCPVVKVAVEMTAESLVAGAELATTRDPVRTCAWLDEMEWLQGFRADAIEDCYILLQSIGATEEAIGNIRAAAVRAEREVQAAAETLKPQCAQL